MNYEVINGNNINILKNYPDNYFDSIVTDPPYGLGKEPNANELMKDWIEHGYHEIEGKGFMGKEWDAFVPQPIFWKEVYRVLKPGGHVLAFYGTRTYDWGVMAMRFAGFEVRDCIQWLYGSGFPKSHNISKAIDKKEGNPNLTTDLARDLKKARESRGISKTKADEMFCGGTTLYSWYEGRKDGIQLPTSIYMRKIADAFPELEKYVGLTMEAEREVIGKGKAGLTKGDIANFSGETEFDITAPSTDAAKQWDGWGTALKPANEPIVLARKPLEKGLSIAENILKWGVGGINIDASRIEGIKPQVTRSSSMFQSKHDGRLSDESHIGRFPANIILDEVAAEILDEQSGISKGWDKGKQPRPTNHNWTNKEHLSYHINDKGGASRFFYVAKASKSERNKGLDNSNFHPTVKPIKLMQYLVKIITPPNGIVLDPFCGSGTTGVACKIDGFNFVGIEQDPDYTKIAQARINNTKVELKQLEIF